MQSDTSGAQDHEQSASSAADENTSSDNQTRTISFEDHKRALDDMHRFKSQARELEQKYTQLQSQLDTKRKADLEGANDWKSLYEQEKAARAELENKHGSLRENIVYNEKFRAVNAALAKSGLRPDALKILERETLDSIEVEATSQGRFLVHGVDLFVDQFKKQFPFAFQETSPPKINAGGGATGSSFGDEELTPAYMVNLERTDKAKYYELMPKFLAQRKAKLKNN